MQTTQQLPTAGLDTLLKQLVGSVSRKHEEPDSAADNRDPRPAPQASKPVVRRSGRVRSQPVRKIGFVDTSYLNDDMASVDDEESSEHEDPVPITPRHQADLPELRPRPRLPTASEEKYLSAPVYTPVPDAAAPAAAARSNHNAAVSAQVFKMVYTATPQGAARRALLAAAVGHMNQEMGEKLVEDLGLNFLGARLQSKWELHEELLFCLGMLDKYRMFRYIRNCYLKQRTVHELNGYYHNVWKTRGSPIADEYFALLDSHSTASDFEAFEDDIRGRLFDAWDVRKHGKMPDRVQALPFQGTVPTKQRTAKHGNGKAAAGANRRRAGAGAAGGTLPTQPRDIAAGSGSIKGTPASSLMTEDDKIRAFTVQAPAALPGASPTALMKLRRSDSDGSVEGSAPAAIHATAAAEAAAALAAAAPAAPPAAKPKPKAVAGVRVRQPHTKAADKQHSPRQSVRQQQQQRRHHVPQPLFQRKPQPQQQQQAQRIVPLLQVGGNQQLPTVLLLSVPQQGPQQPGQPQQQQQHMLVHGSNAALLLQAQLQQRMAAAAAAAVAARNTGPAAAAQAAVTGRPPSATSQAGTAPAGASEAASQSAQQSAAAAAIAAAAASAGPAAFGATSPGHSLIAGVPFPKMPEMPVPEANDHLAVEAWLKALPGCRSAVSDYMQQVKVTADLAVQEQQRRIAQLQQQRQDALSQADSYLQTLDAKQREFLASLAAHRRQELSKQLAKAAASKAAAEEKALKRIQHKQQQQQAAAEQDQQKQLLEKVQEVLHVKQEQEQQQPQQQQPHTLAESALLLHRLGQVLQSKQQLAQTQQQSQQLPQQQQLPKQQQQQQGLGSQNGGPLAAVEDQAPALASGTGTPELQQQGSDVANGIRDFVGNQPKRTKQGMRSRYSVQRPHSSAAEKEEQQQQLPDTQGALAAAGAAGRCITTAVTGTVNKAAASAAALAAGAAAPSLKRPLQEGQQQPSAATTAAVGTAAGSGGVGSRLPLTGWPCVALLDDSDGDTGSPLKPEAKRIKKEPATAAADAAPGDGGGSSEDDVVCLEA